MLLAFFAHRSGLAAAVPAHLAIPEEVLQIWGQTCDALVAPEPGAVASGRGAQSGVSSSSGGGGGSDGSADAPVAAAPSPEGMLTLFQLLLGTLYYGKPERRGCRVSSRRFETPALRRGRVVDACGAAEGCPPYPVLAGRPGLVAGRHVEVDYGTDIIHFGGFTAAVTPNEVQYTALVSGCA